MTMSEPVIRLVSAPTTVTKYEQARNRMLEYNGKKSESKVEKCVQPKPPHSLSQSVNVLEKEDQDRDRHFENVHKSNAFQAKMKIKMARY